MSQVAAATGISSTLRSAPLLTALAVVRSVLGLAVTSLSIYLLGAAGYGQYSVVFAIAAALMSGYGSMFPVVVSRMVEARAADQLHEGSAIARTALLLVVPGIALLLLVGLAMFWFMPRGADYLTLIVAVTLIVCCQLTTQVAGSILEGAGQVNRSALLTLNAQAVVFVVLAGIAVTQTQLGLQGYMLLLACASLHESGWALALSRTHAKGPGPWYFGSLFRSIAHSGVKLQTAAAVTVITEPVVKLLLVAQVGPASMAIYDLASKLANGIQAIFAASIRLFQQFARGANLERQLAMQSVANLSWPPALLAAALVATLALPVIAQSLSLDDDLLRTAFVLCALANWLSVVGGAMFMSLISFGNYRGVLLIQVSNVAASIAAAAVFVPLFGLAGAFVGLLAGMVVAVALIEWQFAQQPMEHRASLVGLARPMIGRLSAALAVLLAPVPLLRWTAGNRTVYWLVAACLVLLIAVLAWREPVSVSARQSYRS